MVLPQTWNFLRVGTSVVFVDFASRIVYKILTEPQARNVIEYMDWYLSLPNNIARHFPEPVSIGRQARSHYIYSEYVVPGKRYVPTLHTFPWIAKQILSILRSISDSDGFGPQHNNLTYGNVLYRGKDVYIIDWTSFSRDGRPLFDYLAFSDSVYWYFYGSKITDASLRFVRKSISLARSEYVDKLGRSDKWFEDILREYISRIYPPHSGFAYRMALEKIVQLMF